ncbi:hypothetical protein [Cohnella nanjingensis]|uniref:PilZ domain-containing protein n=1 Tax=Cohnella nanjingensis TaxID=1387779 RepID=A0A7X0RSR9_9BACL|nr:hypothetical protein [Cohnella nanjingensis]MBB6671730.1 hypothetical protein [Cohnella nanjingensis]
MREDELVAQRKYVPMALYESVIAEMRIIEVGGRAVDTKSHNVLLLNLNPDGLRFKTTLILKPEGDWRVALRFGMEGYLLEARGRVRRAEREGQWWEYGVEMDRNPAMKLLLTRALNLRLARCSPAIRKIHALYGRTSFGTERTRGTGPRPGGEQA